MSFQVSRPKLTFPNNVADFVRAEYARANTILEYGSGGSTVLAAEMLDKKVFSVESDPDWAAKISRFLEINYPASDVTLHHANIGKTKEWGLPAQYSKLRALRYLSYARSVWNRPDFEHPDVILIDGRFRISCLFVSLMRVQKPVRILFDDYANRSIYHMVERYAEPVDLVGRMAVFEAAPGMRRPHWSVDRLRAEILP